MATNLILVACVIVLGLCCLACHFNKKTVSPTEEERKRQNAGIQIRHHWERIVLEAKAAGLDVTIANHYDSVQLFRRVNSTKIRITHTEHKSERY